MYNYEEQKPELFTENMQETFLAIRDKTHRLIDQSGAAKMGHITDAFGAIDIWSLMACVDRLVELKEISEILYGGVIEVIAQNRIFVRNK